MSPLPSNTLIFCTVFLVSQVTLAVSSWQQYVRAPKTSMVRPVPILSIAGNVTRPNALLVPGGAVTTLSRSPPPTQPSWPTGTNATASSYHAPNYGDGVHRTYYPWNAVDGNLTTFWNDNTMAAYPDTLSITSPISVQLSGITVVSSTDGVLVDFDISILESGSWILAASVTGNSAVQVQVPFNNTVNTTAVRITVTLDQNTASGEFTRIVEVWPGLVPTQQLPPTIVMDFGQNVVGYPVISFAGASNNTPGIRVAFSETKEYLTDISDFTRSANGDTITPGTDQFAVPITPTTWTDTHGCSYGNQVCADGLHGFRYLKIFLDALDSDAPYTQSYGQIEIDYVALNFSAFLGTPDTFTGWFECSDDSLNQFWYDAAYTSEMCTDVFRADDCDPRGAASPTLLGKQVILDGAKRDRDPYVGDLAVSARTVYLTHSQNAIAARNNLADLADHQRDDGWIPPASINDYTLPLFDYPLWWVTCSYDYVLYTGDLDYAETYYSVLTNVLNKFYPSVTNASSGLLSKGLNRTSGYGDYAFLPRTGQITYYNALYVAALQNAAQLARFLGNHANDAENWSSRASTVAAAMNTDLWDPAVGAYLDSTTGAATHGQDGNGLASLYGIANRSRVTSALSYFARHASLPYGTAFFDNDVLGDGFSQRIYAFISYFEIQARFANNLATSAIAEIKRLYGWMAQNDPKVTFWVGVGSQGSMYEGAYTSAAHGWSTGVLPALTNYVLGVVPTGPGFATWRVKPMPAGGVTWACGVVPTPKGGLALNWTMVCTAPCEFLLIITAPPGTRGKVSVPLISVSDTVTVDGVNAWVSRKRVMYGAIYTDGYVTVDLKAGKHVVEVSKTG